ncbi:IclR family transcriptional regulator [Gordonia terrae]|uniref:IclR family transcriptional regulator n=1 Tax=Gordonia terrae TaxID=2055 RepID=UPI003F6CC53E
MARRLLTILDCFDVSRTELSLSDIAHIAGLPVSTTRRLIVELVEWGGLERQSNGKYRIGQRLWQVAASASVQHTLRVRALSCMHDLFAATSQNVQLMVLDGSEALCIEKLSHDRSVVNLTQVAGRTPLHASAAGKVLLAYAPAEFTREYVSRGLPRLMPRTIVQPGRFMASLAEVRRAGVAHSREELTPGVCSVAAPVTGPSGDVEAALGLLVPHTMRLDRLESAVRTAAKGISRSLSTTGDLA